MLLKTIIGFLIIAFLGFVIWMNATPGHFQLTTNCFGYVEYIRSHQVQFRGTWIGKDGKTHGMPCELGPGKSLSVTLKEQVLLLVSKLDFYK